MEKVEEKKTEKTLSKVEEGVKFLEGFLEEVNNQKKYIIFLFEKDMLNVINELEKDVKAFLASNQKKNFKKVLEFKDRIKDYLEDTNFQFREKEEELLKGLEVAMNVLIEDKTKVAAKQLGEELICFDVSNSAYLEMLKVVESERGLTQIYLQMVGVAESLINKKK